MEDMPFVPEFDMPEVPDMDVGLGEVRLLGTLPFGPS
jgi:hypothetical protein